MASIAGFDPLRYALLNVPSFVLVLGLFVGVLYVGINLCSTHDCDSMDTIKDEHSCFEHRATPSLSDIGDVLPGQFRQSCGR